MAVSVSGVENRFMYVFDGTTPTPFFAKFIQLTQPNVPLVLPRATTGIQTDGGRMTANAATFIEDPTVPFQPIDITLQIAHMSERLEMIDALGNPFNKGSWVVGGDTWAPLATNAIGNRVDASGNTVPALPPKDVPQQNGMVSLVVEYLVPNEATTGTAFYAKLDGFVVTSIEDSIEGQLAFFNVTGQLWGGISVLSALPAGNESTPS